MKTFSFSKNERTVTNCLLGKNISNTSFFSNRLIYDDKKAESHGTEGEEIKEQKEVHKLSGSELKAEYEATKASVEERIKKYEGKPNYKVFVNYARGRLAAFDKDMKQYAVLEPKQIRNNLQMLRSILFQVRKDEVQAAKENILAKIEERKQYYVKRFQERMDRLEQNKKIAEEDPQVIAVARRLKANYLAYTIANFNVRIRNVADSVAQQMNNSVDPDNTADALLAYFKSVEEGLTATNDPESANGKAEAFYTEFEQQVTGEYLHDRGRKGAIWTDMVKMCSEFAVEENHKRKKDAVHEITGLLDKYKPLLDAIVGSESYKKAAVVYGEFLNEFNSIRSRYFPNEKTEGSLNYRESAIERTKKIREQSEKGWKFERPTTTLVVNYASFANGAINKAAALHIGPEDEELSGVIVDYVKSGTSVQISDEPPLKVNGQSYKHVRILDKNGEPVNDGWVLSSTITEQKTEKKPLKA